MVAKHLLSAISVLLVTAPGAGAVLAPQLNSNQNHVVETGLGDAAVVSGTPDPALLVQAAV